MASKLCDSCQSATAALFCRADSAFLCLSCDSKIHAANKLASRHARVVVCEVCELSPAHVTCKADAASLCLTCDRDIHAANPVAQKHDRVPVVPFYDSALNSIPPFKRSKAAFLKGPELDDVSQEEEEEAASWLLLPNPKVVETTDVNHYIFGDDVDPFLDVDYGSPANPKFEIGDQNSSGSDGVVPNAVHGHQFVPSRGFDLEFASEGKTTYGNSCLINHSVSSSSLEVGLVPDGNAFTDISNPFSAPMSTALDATSRPVPLSSVDREARVLRYREKRKNRKFEKTIRYASRKAYAETRPRIKGRFAKRTDVEVETERIFGFGVVPTY